MLYGRQRLGTDLLEMSPRPGCRPASARCAICRGASAHDAVDVRLQRLEISADELGVGADGAVMQLVTRCASADEFIERFARFTSETDVVVPALPDVKVGTAGRFVIRLNDQSEIMAGRCEVTEVKPLATAPGAPARALMRLRL